jgi:hypothetical protein
MRRAAGATTIGTWGRTPSRDREVQTMRVMLTVEMDTEKANKSIAGGTLSQTMRSVFERVKPEAAFFGAKDGMRTGFIVFDLDEPSDIPTVAEPFFQELGAKVTFIPVMTFEEVKTGLEKYGKG